MDIDQLRRLVRHPKWIWVDGLMCFPEFKPTQKVRMKGDSLWLPEFNDSLTLAYLHHLYAINNGSVRQEGEIWVSSHGVEGKDLAQVLVDSFIQL